MIQNRQLVQLEISHFLGLQWPKALQEENTRKTKHSASVGAVYAHHNLKRIEILWTSENCTLVNFCANSISTFAWGSTQAKLYIIHVDGLIPIYCSDIPVRHLKPLVFPLWRKAYMCIGMDWKNALKGHFRKEFLQ